jgi:peptidoglycan/xylan/chitin deacetylase (PgdA/CDA1 family)
VTLTQGFFRAAAASGLARLVRDSEWRRRRLTILCYHGISLADEHEWRPELFMSRAVFRQRLERLRDGGYRVLPLDEAVRRMYAGTLPPRAVALTFDDGTVDFAECVLPMLREFGMPATVYLTTYYCDHQHPVFMVALSYLLWKGRGAPGGDVAAVVGHPTPLPVATARERDAAWRVIHAHAMRHASTDEERTALLRDVARCTGVDFDALFAGGLLSIMSPDTVRALPRDVVDVQLHTHRHRAPREERAFRRELADNRAAIAALCDAGCAPPAHFCYPSGDYDPCCLPWLRAEGVRTATTCVPALASRDDEPLLLPRYVDAHSQPPAAFDAWVSGVAQLLPQRIARRRHAERRR